MPHVFFLLSYTSFGHLHLGPIVTSSSIASATARLAYIERIPMYSGEIFGFRRIENVRFFPLSDRQLLPSRPRPADWRSAKTRFPSSNFFVVKIYGKGFVT